MVTTRSQTRDIKIEPLDVKNKNGGKAAENSASRKVKVKKKKAVLIKIEKSTPKRKKRLIKASPTGNVKKEADQSLLSVSPPENQTHPSIIPPRHPAFYGLIQERIRSLYYPVDARSGEPHSSLPGSDEAIRDLTLYALLVQAILWNQTRGQQAYPILSQLLHLYPTPVALAGASVDDLVTLLFPIGLYTIRAIRLKAFGAAWCAAPPSPDRRYVRRDYPAKGSGRDAKVGEILGPPDNDAREGWEVAHLPGVGAYALDSFRIFWRDEMRGVDAKPGEEEWRSVVPTDKELRGYLKWRWAKEGWDWDMMTGRRRFVGGASIGADGEHLESVALVRDDLVASPSVVSIVQ